MIVNESLTKLHTLQDVLNWTINRFNAANIYYGHGTDNVWDEALYLVLSTLYIPLDLADKLLTSRITAMERYRIVERVLRRINERIPVAYLTNRSWFCGHEFYIDERVFIPRSPIGELINNHFVGVMRNEPKTILDLCTGSGCIAISCAYEFRNTAVSAVDISRDSLEVTEKNIFNHGFEDRIKIIHSDLFQDMSSMKYSLIVTNPPYVDKEDLNNLPKEFHSEPKLALAAGKNGLELVFRIIAHASHFLTENGILICEVGESMIRLVKQYPEIPFIWLDFKHGGDGVFMLTREELIKYHAYFKLYA
ncbi:50S ribosomal protein L3 glutamine methyltransferase [Candidatus Hartigia pinicola]|nr:50S ribosomal protein L3 glutamine methyltransferase [Candidatus Hartigia pinicola]